MKWNVFFFVVWLLLLLFSEPLESRCKSCVQWANSCQKMGIFLIENKKPLTLKCFARKIIMHMVYWGILLSICMSFNFTCVTFMMSLFLPNWIVMQIRTQNFISSSKYPWFWGYSIGKSPSHPSLSRVKHVFENLLSGKMGLDADVCSFFLCVRRERLQLIIFCTQNPNCHVSATHFNEF